MTLSEISIRKPVFAWMLMFGLILFGGISFMRMGVSQLPDVDFPVVNVSLTLEGAAPEVMETDVVDPVEDAVMAVQGVRNVSSTARNGNANITIEFELGKDIDLAMQEVQTRVAQAQRRLPRELEPPVIMKTNPEDQPILWLTLESDKHELKEMMSYTRDHIKDRFSTVPGVGEVFLGGYIEPSLRVWVSAKKLETYMLSATDVMDTIQNEHSELPGGRIETLVRESNVRTLGEAKSVQEFSDIVINSRGGQPNYTPIKLAQVATVEDGLSDIRRISRAMGKPAVGLGIRKQRGSNAVEVAKLVKARMAQVSKELPPGMNMGINFDATRFIEESVHELNFTLILSALLTALVCWMFLGSFTATVNVLMAIPTSIVGTFIVLYFAGFTLNTFTLLGLSLAIGIVVDDAIMVLENIVRHNEMGKEKTTAALDGSKEITFAAMAATVAIVAIFLPVAFMQGVIGKFFYQFGVTMTVAVLLSLLEALTLTPMRCAQFVHTGKRTTRLGLAMEHSFQWMEKTYVRSLAWALNHRWKVLAMSLAFFFASFAAVKAVKKEFSPAQDQSMFMVRLSTPVGSSITFTDGKFKEAEKFFATRPEIARYYVAVGGFGGGEVNSGMAFVTLKPPGQRGKSADFPDHEPNQEQMMNLVRKELVKIKDVKAFVQDLSMRGFSAGRGYPVEFTLRGSDWDKLSSITHEVMDKMEKTGLMTDIDTDFQLGMPEVQIVPDRQKAAARAVSVTSIGQTVNAMIGGVLVGKYAKGGHRYDIRLRLVDVERGEREEIRKLTVRNNRGELVRLGDISTVAEKPTLQAISRQNRERAISIYSNVKTGKSQEEAVAAAQKIANDTLPSGYRIVTGGNSQTMKESFQTLMFALLLGLIVSYMVLASQFNSFIDPITVLMALPFSLSGAFIALLIGHQSLNIYSFIGLILLMGIVKKNSILLVDFTNQVRDRPDKPAAGAKRFVREALLEACPVRLRPILMTSFATVAGAIPPALAIGPGAETRIPMAIAVIGGVIASTFLTLYVVPCLYSLVARERRTLIHSEGDTSHGHPLSLAPTHGS